MLRSAYQGRFNPATPCNSAIRKEGMVMATDDKTRQQSAYIPQSDTQQGSGQGTGKGNVTQAQRYEGRSLASRRDDPFDYAGYGNSPFRLMRRLNDDLDRLFENFGAGRLFPE